MQKHGSERLKADLLLFVVAIIWGTAFVAQGVAAQYKVAYLFNGVSFVIAGLILLLMIPRGTVITRGQWQWMLVAGAVLFGATALQQVGIFYTKVANAGFLTSLYAVLTPFLLWVLFRERPHGLDMVAVVLAAVGAFFLTTVGRFQVQTGDALELTGAVFWALHFVVLGKFGARYESISFASGHFIVTGFLNLIVGLFVEQLGWLTPWPVLGAIAYRALISIGIGYTLQVWGQKHTPPTDAALILGLEAVFAVIAGWLALGQTLLPIQLAGCGIIFVAVLIAQMKDLQVKWQK